MGDDGKVVIELVGKDSATQTFIKTFQDLQSSMQRLEGQSRGLSSISGILDGIRDHWLGLMSAIGGGYLIHQGLQQFWQSFQENAAAQKTLLELSQRLGATVGDISALEFAAQRSGVGLENFGVSITRMTKNVSAAALGTEQATDEFGQYTFAAGKATQALRELGFVSPEQVAALNNLSLKEKLLAIAEAMKHIPNEADKVRIALDLFGKGGGGMVVMLKEGAQGIQALADKGGRLGVVLDQNMVQRGAAAAGALRDMKDVAHGLGLTITDVVSPPLTQFINGLNQKIIAARESGAATRILTQITSLFGKVWDEPGLSALKNGIIGAQLWGVKGAAIGAASGFMGLRLELKSLVSILNDPMLSMLLMAGMGALAGKSFGVVGAAVGAVAGTGTAVILGIKRDAAKYQKEQLLQGAPDVSGMGEEMPLWPSDPATEALERAILDQNMREKIQKTFGPGIRTKQGTGKGGAGGGDAGAGRLDNFIKTMEEQMGKASGDTMKGLDAWRAKEEKTLAEIEAKTGVSLEARQALANSYQAKREKLEEDYSLFIAKESGDSYQEIEAQARAWLIKYQGFANAEENINNIKARKVLGQQYKDREEQSSLQKGYLDQLAASAPLLSLQVGWQRQGLEIEKELSYLKLDQLLNDRKISLEFYNRARGQLALVNQYKEFAQRQKEWQLQGASGGFQLWQFNRWQEMQTREAEWFKNFLGQAEQWTADSISQGFIDGIEGNQGGREQALKHLFEGAVKQITSWNVQNLWDKLAGSPDKGILGGAQQSALVLVQGGDNCGQRLFSWAERAAALLSNVSPGGGGAPGGSRAPGGFRLPGLPAPGASTPGSTGGSGSGGTFSSQLEGGQFAGMNEAAALWRETGNYWYKTVGPTNFQAGQAGQQSALMGQISNMQLGLGAAGLGLGALGLLTGSQGLVTAGMVLQAAAVAIQIAALIMKMAGVIPGAAQGAILGGSFHPIARFADGAPRISAPTLAWVGEGRDEEAVIPLRHGAVPVRLSGPGGRGQTVYQINLQMHHAPIYGYQPTVAEIRRDAAIFIAGLDQALVEHARKSNRKFIKVG